jgi:hypothetical protein
MGKALADDGFNVTIFCPYDTDIKETRYLHKYSLPFSKDEIFPQNVEVEAAKQGYPHAGLFIMY